MYKFLVLVLFYQVLSINFLTFSNITGRYKSIFYPSTQTFYIPGRIFKDNLLYSPKPYLLSTKGTSDLCAEAKKFLTTKVSELWNNTQVINPCFQYFCSLGRPKLSQNDTSKIKIIDMAKFLQNNDVLHHLTLNYCTKCEDTYLERFEEKMNLKECPWINSTLSCQGYCPTNGYECFPFSSENNLCYSLQENIFMARADALHIGFVKIRLYVIPYIYLFVNTFLFIVNIIMIVVPEINYIRIHFKQNYSFLSRIEMLGAIVSLRNVSTFFLILMNVAFVIGGLLDIINFSLPVYTTSFVLLMFFASIIYEWSLLVLLWAHVYDQSDKMALLKSLSPINAFSWALITSILVIYFITLLVLYIINSMMETIVTQVLFLALVFLLGITILILSAFLIFFSTRLLLLMYQNIETKNFSIYFFKLKVIQYQLT